MNNAGTLVIRINALTRKANKRRGRWRRWKIAGSFPRDFLAKAVYTSQDISVCTQVQESATGLKFRPRRSGKVLMDCIMSRYSRAFRRK